MPEAAAWPDPWKVEAQPGHSFLTCSCPATGCQPPEEGPITRLTIGRGGHHTTGVGKRCGHRPRLPVTQALPPPPDREAFGQVRGSPRLPSQWAEPPPRTTLRRHGALRSGQWCRRRPLRTAWGPHVALAPCPSVSGGTPGPPHSAPSSRPGAGSRPAGPQEPYPRPAAAGGRWGRCPRRPTFGSVFPEQHSQQKPGHSSTTDRLSNWFTWGPYRP